jgi:ribosomal protein L11 methylase PrmA
MDGTPLDWASKMLPMSSYLNYSTFAHIHMHVRSQIKHQDAAGEGTGVRQARISKPMLTGIIASLTRAVERLSAKDVQTEWGEYYADTNYSDEATNDKSAILEKFAQAYLTRGAIVHDLGANTGRFSRIAAKYADTVIAHDIDDMAVEHHYRHTRANGPENVLPLMLDLTNPSPAIGWGLSERSSFPQRADGGVGIALALIHHLAISNNVPLPRLAEFFANIFPTLIIEFVPKEDSQVQRLLATRKDIFDQYTSAGFEHAFSQRFDIRERCPVRESNRMMYVMTRQS